MSTIGLVTTFRFAPCENDASVERCWSVLSSFLLYHLDKGVDHVFLYADAEDGSNDIFLERVADSFDRSQVSVYERDEAQKERQRATSRLWDVLGPICDSEVPARQSLNAEEALGKASKKNLDWLLHLDIDELLYTAEASIRAHFDRLKQEGVEQMTYANHEAVPSGEKVSNYFTEVELFRVNHLVLPLSKEVGECTSFWRRRRGHGQYMLAYDNGKAAVRVLPGRIVPQSVHRWRTLRTEELNENLEADENKGSSLQGTRKLVSRSALADPRELKFDEVLHCRDPCVLHYPSCGLDWLRDKYRLLGSFPSAWFGGKLPIAPCFHLDARDAITGGVENCIPNQSNGHDDDEYDDDEPHDPRPPPDEGATQTQEVDKGDKGEGKNQDKDTVRELYRKQVMLCPDEHAQEMQEQLRCGVLRLIGGPAAIIKRLRDENVSGSMISADAPHPAIPCQKLVTYGERDEPRAKGGDNGSIAKDSRDQRETLSATDGQPEGAGEGMAEALKQISDEDGSADADGSFGFENSWIVAAVARDYLC